MTTVGIDPRKGVRPKLNLLSAYTIYEQDCPVFKPDISATLAINSPLYKRLEDSLADQSQLKAEHDADEARMRNAAITANVPIRTHDTDDGGIVADEDMVLPEDWDSQSSLKK